MASTFCCSITPFDETGGFDQEAWRQHCRRIAGAGIGLYAGGSSPGEQYALTRDEVEQLLRIAVEELKGTVPVRAMGVEPRHAPQMCEFAALASDCGVDALQVYSLDIGHGGVPSDPELERYFRTVLEASALPAILSSHFFGGYVLSDAMLERLLTDYPQIIGLNVSTNDMGYLSRVLERFAQRVEIHVGGPLHALSGMAMGATGFLSSEANIAPRLAAAVIEQWNAGSYREAFDAYARLMQLFTTRPEGSGASVRWTKAALQILGLPGGTLRSPNLPLPAEERARIAERLEKLEIRQYL